MTNKEFQYWIEGYLSLSDEKQLDAQQVKMIRNHAQLVQATVGGVNLSAHHFAAGLELKLAQEGLVSRSDVEKLVAEVLLAS